MLRSTPKNWQIFLIIDGQISWYSEKAEVMPVCTKDDMNDKIIVQWVNHPIYQKYLKNLFTLKLIHIYMSDKFSKYLKRFCKNHNAQHALLNIIENWKSNINKGNKIGTIFMDLSKVFKTLHHSLLTLSCIMLWNGQIYFKSLAVSTPQDF